MIFSLRRNFAVWLTLAWAVTGVCSRALEPATPLNRLGRQGWSVENGLPQNTVPVILQTRNGYLLAATEQGLARFDGMSFRIFDHATAPAFPDAEIRCLLDAGKPGGPDDIWIGTADGLVHLVGDRPALLTAKDGLPSNSLRGLVQTTDGAIWAWTERGLARLAGGSVTGSVQGTGAGRFETVARMGAPAGEITSIAADGNNGLWVATTEGTARLERGAWQQVAPGRRPPEGTSESRSLPRSGMVTSIAGGDVLIAPGNGVWLAHGGAVTSVAPQADLPAEQVSFLARTRDGVVAVAGKTTLTLVDPANSKARGLGRMVVGRQLPGSRIETLFADREGSLWVGTDRGLARIVLGKDGVTVEALPATDPMSADAVITLVEDREGDLWIGTETAGLHILRDARFHTLGAGDGLNSDNLTAIVEDAHKTLWIGSRDAGLNRVTRIQTTHITTANGMLSDVILSLAAGPDGAVWVGTPDGLNKIAAAGVLSYTSADGLPDDFIRSLLVAPDNSLWIGTRRGLTHFFHGRFQTYTESDGLGSNLVGALARTPDGDLWIATLNGLSQLHQGHLITHTTAEGLSSNVITSLEASANGEIWIGTQNDGLNLWDGHRFMAFAGARRQDETPLPAAIHAILDDGRGHIWIATKSGLTRADTGVLRACAQRQPCRLDGGALTSFTTADGLRSRETSSNSHPTAIRASDGELWFTSPRGVVVVDPSHFPASAPAPPAVIEHFAVDDREADDAETDPSRMTRIEAGHMRFRFDYAGLSFAFPQKVRYAYKLEGFDPSWTEAGSRRTAYYTNIPPGTYRFLVRAATDSADLAPGGWSNAPAGTDAPGTASLTFVLLPHLYQTVWFRVLAAASVMLALAGLFRLRVLRVEREFKAVIAERNRIAREIHDTLAQGYVGISLQLELIGELLRHNKADAAGRLLSTAQELVRAGLEDARRSIWALRSQDAEEIALPVRLRREAEKVQGRTLAASFDVHGAYRPLASATEQEILRIAQEAIHNVRKHAGARRLSVRLEYDRGSVVLTVSDDGTGFTGAGEAKQLAAGGGFGLVGMQERAGLIHGELTIESQPGAGTTVRLAVPAMPPHADSDRPLVDTEERALTAVSTSAADRAGGGQEKL